MQNQPFVASFASREPVPEVLGQLHAAGVERDDVALLMAEEQHSPRFGLVAGHKLAAGAAFGAALGAVLGGLVGGMLALGELSSVGISIASLAGLGLGGGIGSVVGAIVGLRARSYRAQLGERADDGAPVLLAVWVADQARAERVSQILAR